MLKVYWYFSLVIYKWAPWHKELYRNIPPHMLSVGPAPQKYLHFVCFYFLTFWKYVVHHFDWVTGRRWELTGVDVMSLVSMEWRSLTIDDWLTGCWTEPIGMLGFMFGAPWAPMRGRHPLLHSCRICSPGSILSPAGAHQPRLFFFFWRI